MTLAAYMGQQQTPWSAWGQTNWGNMLPVDVGAEVPTALDPSPISLPTVGAAPAPQHPAGLGLGWNLGTAQLALNGLGTLGGLWSAFQTQKMAKKQFNFNKDFAETNLANSIKSYNTSLADRARSRGAMESQTAAQTQNYIDQNSLSRQRG